MPAPGAPVQVHNINMALSRPFGNAGNIDNFIIPPFGLLRKGDVPENLMEMQPRSQLAVMLPETHNNIVRNQLIQICETVDQNIVQNGVFKVD